MFLYQVYAVRYSPAGDFHSHIIVKDDFSQIQIDLTPEEKAELDRLGEAVFARHQVVLAAKMAQPLETAQLPAPERIEDADFSEVQV